MLPGRLPVVGISWLLNQTQCLAAETGRTRGKFPRCRSRYLMKVVENEGRYHGNESSVPGTLPPTRRRRPCSAVCMPLCSLPSQVERLQQGPHYLQAARHLW